MNNFNKMSENAEKMRERSQCTMNSWNKSICECTKDLENRIKAKPLHSLLIAGGVGFLLSCLSKK